MITPPFNKNMTIIVNSSARSCIIIDRTNKLNSPPGRTPPLLYYRQRYRYRSCDKGMCDNRHKKVPFVIKMATELGLFYAKTDVFLHFDCAIKPGIGYI